MFIFHFVSQSAATVLFLLSLWKKNLIKFRIIFLFWKKRWPFMQVSSTINRLKHSISEVGRQISFDQIILSRLLKLQKYILIWRILQNWALSLILILNRRFMILFVRFRLVLPKNIQESDSPLVFSLLTMKFWRFQGESLCFSVW